MLEAHSAGGQGPLPLEEPKSKAGDFHRSGKATFTRLTGVQRVGSGRLHPLSEPRGLEAEKPVVS